MSVNGCGIKAKYFALTRALMMADACDACRTLVPCRFDPIKRR